MPCRLVHFLCLVAISTALAPTITTAADPELERRLQAADLDTLAAEVLTKGDPQRGALLFFKSAAACSQCHVGGAKASPLGPDIASLGSDQKIDATYIVESILQPSKSIRKGYETVSILTDEGQVISGLIVNETDQQITLRSSTDLSKETVIPTETVENKRINKQSLMPAGLVGSLNDRREFLDLARYVYEVASGGKPRQAQLQPAAADLLVVDDTADLDHAGIIRSLGTTDLQAGQQIFNGHCKNCHGIDGNTPTLPTARAFGSQKLKFGADPYSMLQTLTTGAGLMAPMQHLSPKQRYQVIHYIRQSLMRGRNPEFTAADESYLASLPKGTGTGQRLPDGDRDFGPVLGSQIGNDVNVALTFRLPGDVSVGYDMHRLRVVDAWQGGFLDLSQTQHYLQRGERMPQIKGDRITGLGSWSWAYRDSLSDDAFEIPTGSKPDRGPIDTSIGSFEGYYLHGEKAVLRYTMHQRSILETIDANQLGPVQLLQHTLRVGPGDKPLRLTVGQMSVKKASAQSEAFWPAGLITDRNSTELMTSGSASDSLPIVTGQTAAKAAKESFTNQTVHIVKGKQATELDLGTPNRSVIVRFRADGTGTLISSGPEKGKWEANGKSLFIRGNRLVFDIGWVGAIDSGKPVRDGKWHEAALVVRDDITKLYVDGKLAAERKEFRRPAEKKHVLKIGATATNFGGDFQGTIDWVKILDRALTADEIKSLQPNQPQQVDAIGNVLFDWKPESDAPTEPAAPKTEPSLTENQSAFAASVDGQVDGLQWDVFPSGRVVLTIPPAKTSRLVRVHRCSTETDALIGPQYTDSDPTKLRSTLADVLALAKEAPRLDPAELTEGGPRRWSQELVVEGKLGEPINGYALDTVPVPDSNPWNAWLRTSAVDFLSDGRAVVSTHGGDVFLVDGIDDKLDRVVWKRYVSGLFEPFGLRVIDDVIYVTCRDGLKRLHDYNGDDEVDFVECFWNDDDVSSMFHAYNFDLQTDSEGYFYFAKAGQYTKHHRPGTIMRIPPDGGKVDIVAWGLRTPNGMGKLFDDRFTVSDNQGPWMPAGKISLIKRNGFYGNMPLNKEQDAWLRGRYEGELPTTFDQPIIWMPQELDNSCGGQVWSTDERFGPLSNRLIHSSFGKGWLYYMSLQEVGDQAQSSIVALPHQWDAGVMRLRVNPADGQVYGTGLSGWQGPRGGKDGCLQRLRYTGKASRLIDDVKVVQGGIVLRFNFDLDQASATDPDSYQSAMWNYLWSRRYGSDQFSVNNPDQKGRDKLTIAKCIPLDNQTVRLDIPDLKVCNQLLMKVKLKDRDGQAFVEDLYLTINAIPEGE